ncbi:MAG: hypothetical protein QOH65_445 [Methylobacteriaceae bacterium]|nr:hypothetical protein [Methylobacteriaceae bacterium]
MNSKSPINLATMGPCSVKEQRGQYFVEFREKRTAWCAVRLAGGGAEQGRLRLHRQQPLALHLLAGELAGAADGFGPFACTLLGGLLVVTAQLHLPEDALALHLLFERLEGLIDIVVADENLHAFFLPSAFRPRTGMNENVALSARLAGGGALSRKG